MVKPEQNHAARCIQCRETDPEQGGAISIAHHAKIARTGGTHGGQNAGSGGLENLAFIAFSSDEVLDSVEILGQQESVGT